MSKKIFEQVIEEHTCSKYNLPYSRTKEPELVASATYYGTIKDAKQVLVTKINQMSAQIHMSNMAYDPFFDKQGAPGNVIITSDEIVDEYFSIFDYYKSNTIYHDGNEVGNTGFNHVGKMSSDSPWRKEVYTHPDCPKDKIYILNRFIKEVGGTITII